MNNDKPWGVVAGSVLGGLTFGLPGAIIGGLIGSVFQEAFICPRCGSSLESIPYLHGSKFKSCKKCGYSRIENNTGQSGRGSY